MKVIEILNDKSFLLDGVPVNKRYELKQELDNTLKAVSVYNEVDILFENVQANEIQIDGEKFTNVIDAIFAFEPFKASAGGSGVIGGATSALQVNGNTHLNNIDTALGTPSDAPATSDTGTFSIIAFLKRFAQNSTTLLTRIPAGVGRTFTVTVATGAGTVPAGSKSVGFAVFGSANATIAGASVPSGVAIDETASGNDTINAITYDATGTTLIVTRLV
jgi:hypothetical protein